MMMMIFRWLSVCLSQSGIVSKRLSLSWEHDSPRPISQVVWNKGGVRGNCISEISRYISEVSNKMWKLIPDLMTIIHLFNCVQKLWYNCACQPQCQAWSAVNERSKLPNVVEIWTANPSGEVCSGCTYNHKWMYVKMKTTHNSLNSIMSYSCGKSTIIAVIC